MSNQNISLNKIYKFNSTGTNSIKKINKKKIYNTINTAENILFNNYINNSESTTKKINKSKIDEILKTRYYYYLCRNNKLKPILFSSIENIPQKDIMIRAVNEILIQFNNIYKKISNDIQESKGIIVSYKAGKYGPVIPFITPKYISNHKEYITKINPILEKTKIFIDKLEELKKDIPKNIQAIKDLILTKYFIKENINLLLLSVILDKKNIFKYLVLKKIFKEYYQDILEYLFYFKKYDFIIFLLKNNNDIPMDVKSKEFTTLMYVAKFSYNNNKNDKENIINLLFNNINIKNIVNNIDENGKTALVIACENNNIYFLDKLLSMPNISLKINKDEINNIPKISEEIKNKIDQYIRNGTPINKEYTMKNTIIGYNPSFGKKSTSSTSNTSNTSNTGNYFYNLSNNNNVKLFNNPMTR